MAWAVVIVTAAPMPSRTSGGVPVKLSVTAYAVPPAVLGATPTEVTVAGSVPVPPSGRTVAGWPTLTDGILVTSTEAVTTCGPAPMTSTVAVLELAATVSPGVMFTAATVPAIGLWIVAAARFCCATATCAAAAVTAARSAAICSGVIAREELPPLPVRPPADGWALDGVGLLTGSARSRPGFGGVARR